MQLNQLTQIINSFQNKKIAVIGDLMLDHYIWGKVDRISPEAPVPVIEVNKEEYRLGGAANVALNINSLGAEAFLFGVAGNDFYSEVLNNKLKSFNLSNEYIIRDESRPTTLKTRIIAQSQQIARLDYEKKNDITQALSSQILSAFINVLPSLDGVILEDYNKGVLTEDIITKIITLCNEQSVIVTVDPKFKNFFQYSNCTIFKPNFIELQKNTGMPLENDEQLDQAAKLIFKKLSPQYLIVTRGEKGMVIFSADGSKKIIPTYAQEVFDVSGAGDTTISALTLSLGSGLDIINSAIIANHAAGAVCGKIGIQPVIPSDIINSFKDYNNLI